LLAAVRFQVADVVGLRKTFVRPDEIVARYQELMRLKEGKAPMRKAA